MIQTRQTQNTTVIGLIALLAFGMWASVAVGEAKSGIQPAEFGESKTTLWSPTLEWTIDNDSYEGNPFDLVAKATFTHESGKETRVTEMFYAGEDTWKFRFTGTRPGKWTFITQADGKNGTTKDDDLHGRKGTITVKPNPDANATGFLTSIGNKYAIQTADGELQPIPGHIFRPWSDSGNDIGNHARPDEFWNIIDQVIASAEENGFRRVFMNEVVNGWFKLGAKGHDDHSSENPDRETFEYLEKSINKLHDNGMALHIWAWGDEARKWTPKGVGGINGKPDRRLQRYIAARLGPLPGWTMNYGFDLQEWVSESQCRAWADYMHDHMGWDHLLSARGRFGGHLDVNAYSGLKHSYRDAVSNLNDDRNRPHVFEERDLYKRNGAGMNWTRQHVWLYTMAGGHAGFFGSYWKHGDKYPNPEVLRTHLTFWRENNRLLADMSKANNLTDGYCLRTSDRANYVLYKQDTSSIELDLSRMDGSQPAVAVDTTKAYREIDIGPLKPGEHTWKAPHKSDWAIAVGRFGQTPPAGGDADD
ncbi:MAG: DUF5060 domain-containing protein [Phycisphaerae bacterium]|nr:DUF5060 domain-containing protein [Phycisphaerae bacterium]